MFGVYVHWPFCAALCPYCDFVKALARDVDEDAWVAAMEAEIAHQAGHGGGPAETVYFGGGTPSLMPPALVGRLLGRIAERWHLPDGAEVTLYLVDWRDVANRAVLSRGLIGQIRRGTLAFEAEITGLADRLNQPTGAAYLPTCSARLGDQVCGVDLTDPAFRGTATVSAVAETQRFTLTGLAAYADGWFAGGAVTWLTGANAGLTGHVKSHVAAGPEAFVELWLSPPLAVLPGDTLEITAGCDKTLDTCIAKFGNVENFCGMPHMPGDDVAARYPNSGERHDGGSLFKT